MTINTYRYRMSMFGVVHIVDKNEVALCGRADGWAIYEPEVGDHMCPECRAKRDEQTTAPVAPVTPAFGVDGLALAIAVIDEQISFWRTEAMNSKFDWKRECFAKANLLEGIKGKIKGAVYNASTITAAPTTDAVPATKRVKLSDGLSYRYKTEWIGARYVCVKHVMRNGEKQALCGKKYSFEKRKPNVKQVGPGKLYDAIETCAECERIAAS